MKEFVEKLIGRLEYLQKDKYVLAPTVCYVLEGVKQYVNQLAEEFATDINVVSNNDWIPVSSGNLPKENQTVYATVTNGKETIAVEIEFYTNDWRNGVWQMIAWIPLPPKYQPKGE